MNSDQTESIGRLERQMLALKGEVSRGQTKLRAAYALAMAVVMGGALMATGNVPAFAQGQNGVEHRVTVLEQKVAALQSANSSLQAALNAEIAARQAGDAGLQTAINNEASDRSGADHTIMVNLAAERDARIAADTTLQNNIDAEAAARAAADASLQSAIDGLLDKTQFISVADGQMYVSDTNLWIVNGMGSTETTNGLGNLIVGYNEPRSTGNSRGGSHNLVLGTRCNYSSFGGILAGWQCGVENKYGIAIGLDCNATGPYASVFGGYNNTASGWGSAIVGGVSNKAKGGWGCIFGGSANNAGGDVNPQAYAVVVGGNENTASGYFSCVTGGAGNTASGTTAVVSGGASLTESTNFGWAAGSIGGTTYTGKFRSH